jgi:hypothetical protein
LLCHFALLFLHFERGWWGENLLGDFLCHCEADEVSRSNLGGVVEYGDCHAPLAMTKSVGLDETSNFKMPEFERKSKLSSL